MFRNKNKIDNDINVEHGTGGKPIKKAISPVSTSESTKKFSKTTKIPTLKSLAIKIVQKQESQM